MLSWSGVLVCAMGASIGHLLLGSVTSTLRSRVSRTSAFYIRISFGNSRAVELPVIFALVKTKCWDIFIFHLIVAMALVVL